MIILEGTIARKCAYPNVWKSGAAKETSRSKPLLTMHETEKSREKEEKGENEENGFCFVMLL